MTHFLVLVLLSAFVYGSDREYFRRLDALRPEGPCNSAGGSCIFAADCEQLTEESGLCPEQRSQGVECCYGASRRETRCRRLGGECMSSTSDNCRTTSDRARDCGRGQTCCILL